MATKRLAAALVLIVSFLAIFMLRQGPKADRIVIGVTQIIDHPSLNAVREGVFESLAAEGLTRERGVRILYDEAQGNPALANQIAQKFASQEVDLIIAIATPSAQAVRNTTRIPLVFATLTDPVGAKVVSDLEFPEAGVTGTRNKPLFSDHLNLMRTVLKREDTLRLGVILNYGEDNSVALLKELKGLGPKENFILVTAAAQNAKEVRSAIESLVGRIDALLLLQDNTVASALSALLSTAEPHRIPVFSTYLEAVEQGALAGLAFDEHAIGLQTGRLAARLLEDPTQSLPVEDADVRAFAVNASSAQRLGLAQHLLTSADTVYP